MLGATCPAAATTFPAWVTGEPILQLLDNVFSIELCMPGDSIPWISVCVFAVTFRVWPNRNGREESLSEPDYGMTERGISSIIPQFHVFTYMRQKGWGFGFAAAAAEHQPAGGTVAVQPMDSLMLLLLLQ